MNRLRVKVKRMVCHKCCAKKGMPKVYLVFKDSYGWVCPQCGYEKPVKEWKEAQI